MKNQLKVHLNYQVLSFIQKMFLSKPKKWSDIFGSPILFHLIVHVDQVSSRCFLHSRIFTFAHTLLCPPLPLAFTKSAAFFFYCYFPGCRHRHATHVRESQGPVTPRRPSFSLSNKDWDYEIKIIKSNVFNCETFHRLEVFEICTLDVLSDVAYTHFFIRNLVNVCALGP